MKGRTASALLVALGALASLAAGSAHATTQDACPATPSAAASGVSVTYPATAALVGPANASVAALLDAGGAQADYLVEYGTTADYGLCTPATPRPSARTRC